MKTHPDARIPQRQTPGSTCADLHALLPDGVDELVILPGERCAVETGLRVAIPEGWEIQVRARSGISLKHGITMANGIGSIDSDFRGMLAVLVVNLDREAYTIRNGDRIAQMKVSQVPPWIAQEVEDLDDTERGQGGFGSTGMSAEKAGK
ncbi:dUTP diphosphatase [Cereibacter sphaeroides]|uniref:dUTP diphosphatase n=1 Tax=Cereibacter sphaeroides TaxID=1063 RepID=UPI001F2A92CC|nr:dUTP diphosphatase [Cereibacter sphaeroides]MCE6959345.1 dUTP diphosphatase [Cereibacter sphaeroides]MCE6972937.1 dUTP diphosphatase [Cereibacter sphaeroides]